MKTKLIAALGLLFSLQAFATTATITGTITDLTGAVVTSGQVTFLLQPGLDTTISGTARFVPSTVTCGINGSGLVKNLALSGACTVTTNTSLTPSGTWYQVCIWPANVKTSCFNTYITGSVDITTANPTPTTSPLYNLVDILNNQTVAGDKTFTGSTTFTGGTSGVYTHSGTLSITHPSLTALTVFSGISSGSAVSFSGSGANLVGLTSSATNSTGTTVGIQGRAASASGIAVQGYNSNASGVVFSGLNSAGAEKFSVTGAGALTAISVTAPTVNAQTSLTINGGTAIIAQTGTGGTVVMSVAPAITGNMTYANTTPVANLTGQVLAYTITGTQKTNSHMVYGGCTLGTDCAVTLSGAAVFTNANSYSCWAQDDTAAAATKIVYGSGSLFTITGTGTDVISFGCVGN